MQSMTKLYYKCTKYERPLIVGLYLMIVKSYIVIIIPNNSLNSAHPTIIAQAKSQPEDQMQVALLFRLTHVCRHKCVCLKLSIIKGSS